MRYQRVREKKRENANKAGERGSLLGMKKKIRQQEFGFVSWGGKRRGAGRKPNGERAGVSHAKRARLPARFPVLVTMKLWAGLQTLRRRHAARQPSGRPARTAWGRRSEDCTGATGPA